VCLWYFTGGLDNADGDNNGGAGGNGRIRFDVSEIGSYYRLWSSLPSAYIDSTSLSSCVGSFLNCLNFSFLISFCFFPMENC
jgi:hypothetical protein